MYHYCGGMLLQLLGICSLRDFSVMGKVHCTRPYCISNCSLEVNLSVVGGS